MHKHRHKQAPPAPTSIAQSRSDALPRTLAFYLPQFHPIPENDAWWGKGFTEWTNVTRAEPAFDGHHQPRRPADLGYYDLRIPEIMEQQAAMARQYGIHGFCYYYYWFAGHRLLEKPLDRMLESGSPDFPFCLCWANENWSRRWDGSEQEVLMKQEYGPNYARRIIRDMLPFLQDKRYVTVDGKPLLLVYRVDIIPDCTEMTAIWREEAELAGLPGLYLVRVESFVDVDPRLYGFDAACEFPPHLLNTVAVADRSTLNNVHPEFEGHLFDYDKVAQHYGNKPTPAYKRFKGVVPAWDNTARKKLKSVVITRSSPALYKAWLSQCLRETVARFKGDERLLFINAWNEWAEGCYLEPDQTFGHQYLEATRDAQATIAAELQAAMRGRVIDKNKPGMDLAIALFDNSQIPEAYEAFLKVVGHDQRSPLALVYLGLIALSSALPDEARNFFDHAIEFSQDRANTMAAIGQRCMEVGEAAFAESYFSAAIKAQPRLHGAYALLADLWEQQGRRNDALRLLSSFLENDGKPQQQILARLVTLARELGDLERECAACLKASAFPDSHARAIELLGYCDAGTAEQIHDEAKRFAANQNTRDTRNAAPGPRQRLRLGFVVGKLDSSRVPWRLEALLRKLDPKYFETFIIAKDNSAGEAVQRLFLLVDAWLPMAGLDAEATDIAIREKGIDILVNLDGHGSLAALEPFLRRSAPLQLNWTAPAMPLALPCVDYVLIDPLFTSDEALAASFSERIAAIGHCAAGEFPLLASHLPRGEADATFTFGCMESISCISLNTWQAWAKILQACPDTRLQLNAGETGNDARLRTLELLAEKGITSERIRWVVALDARGACEAWQGIDLGLCPLTGDSSYALLLGAWAGTASLTCAQGTRWTQAASSLLHSLERDELIATDTNAYVDAAVHLSHDRALVAKHGLTLQHNLRHSPLVDTAGFAKAFATTILGLWQNADGSLENGA